MSRLEVDETCFFASFQDTFERTSTAAAELMEGESERFKFFIEMIIFISKTFERPDQV